MTAFKFKPRLYFVFAVVLIVTSSFVFKFTPDEISRKNQLTTLDRKLEFYAQEIPVDKLKYYMAMSDEGYFYFQHVVPKGGGVFNAREEYDLNAYAYSKKDDEEPVDKLPVEAIRIKTGTHYVRLLTDRDIRLSVFGVSYKTVRSVIEKYPASESIIFRPRVCSTLINHIYYIAYPNEKEVPDFDNCIIERRKEPRKLDTLSVSPLFVLNEDGFLLNPAPPRNALFFE